MKDFKPYHKKEEVLIPSHKTIRFYEDDNLMIFSSLEIFQKYQEKIITELSNTPEDKMLLDLINEWFIINPLKILDLKSFYQLNNFGYRYDLLFADLLEKESCIIIDKKTIQFITTIKMIEDGHQIGPTFGSGGVHFM